MEPTEIGEKSLSATIGLWGDTAKANIPDTDEALYKSLLGKALYKGPWPKNVMKLLDELQDAMESHLLTIYFEVSNDKSVTTSKPSPGDPRGIIEPELDDPQTGTPQL